MGKKQTLLVATLVAEMIACQKRYTDVCGEWSKYGLARQNGAQPNTGPIQTEHTAFKVSLVNFAGAIAALERHAVKMAKKWIGKKSLTSDAKTTLERAKLQLANLQNCVKSSDPARAV